MPIQWALLVQRALLHLVVIERWVQLLQAVSGRAAPPGPLATPAPPPREAWTSSAVSGASYGRAAGPAATGGRTAASASGTSAVPDLRNMTTAQRLSLLQQMDPEKLQDLAARMGVPNYQKEKGLLHRLAPLVLHLPKMVDGERPPAEPGAGTARRGKRAATFDPGACLQVLQRMASQPQEQSEAELAGYRVKQELQPLSRAAGLPVSGRKKGLIDRLMGYLLYLVNRGEHREIPEVELTVRGKPITARIEQFCQNPNCSAPGARVEIGDNIQSVLPWGWCHATCVPARARLRPARPC